MKADESSTAYSSPAPIDFRLPPGQDPEALSGAIFSESTGGTAAGDHDKEKDCIDLAMINAAYYATCKTHEGKTCYNSSLAMARLLAQCGKPLAPMGKQDGN